MRAEVRDAANTVRAMLACGACLPRLAVLRLAAWQLGSDLPDALASRDVSRLVRNGIPERHAIALIRSFPTDRAVARLRTCVDLLATRLPSALTRRALDAWGHRAVSKIQTDPYASIFDLGGSVRDADVVATHHDKIVGHARWHLHGARRRGHTAIPTDTLVRDIARELGMEVTSVQEGLARGLGTAVEVVGPPHAELVMEPGVARDERFIAFEVRWRAIMRFMDRAPTCQELDPEQIRAVDVMCGSALSVLTGPAGSGKTTLARALAHAMGDRCLVAEGGTWPLAVRASDRVELLVVDDANLTSTDQATLIFGLAPRRCHVVLVGNPDLLQPEGHGSVLRDLLDAKACPVATLTRNYRCGESVADLAAAVARGLGQDVPLVSVSGANDLVRQVVREAGAGSHVLVSLDATKEVLNRAVQSTRHAVPVRLRMSEFGEEGVMRTEPSSGRTTVDLGERVVEFDVGDALTATKHATTLLVGDAVVVAKDHPGGEARIGDRGTLVEEGVVLLSDGRRVEFPRGVWMTLGYASTVHTFRGECERVVIPLSHAWDRYQLHAAVSRAKNAATIVGDRRTLQAVLSKHTRRITSLRTLLEM